jgi:regulator of protease activity HflC (stomatin/prohibitin superfamily)
MKKWFRKQRVPLAILTFFTTFLLIYFAPRIFIVVEAGEAGVLFRRLFGGVVTTKVYGEGLHIIPPWDSLDVYSVRINEYPLNTVALSENGIELKITASIRYHPEYDTLPLLHQKVGPEYVSRIVVPVVEASIRRAVGAYRADEFYTTRGPVVAQVNNDASLELALNYISLDGVVIKTVTLPPSIRVAVEEKEVERERLEAYDYRLRVAREEALRKEIEAFGWRNYNVIVGASLSQRLLQWKGIEATEALATSPNSKVVIVGSGKDGLPVILGEDYTKGENPDLNAVDISGKAPDDLANYSALSQRLENMRGVFSQLMQLNSSLGTERDPSMPNPDEADSP